MRRLAGLFALVLMLVGMVPVQCTGWLTSAEGRMACCERAQHDCADQSAADACCASREEGSGQSVPTGSFLPAAPLMVAVAADFPVLHAAFASSAARWFKLAIDARSHRPPGFLTSVLLI